ncbi:hypothetical protein HYT51_02245 [Candidatus Woesearchaeota archaeon]|nr:hypothetical protein [Candidatus Woesearchaeota archaeon]
MRLDKIILENIRSYASEEITFPRGSILLSGDVGSGKSSVLLALDFALFGLQSGGLTGDSLLRNGAQRGFVEVHLAIDNNNFVIRRNLKRQKDSVQQESGFIILDEKKEHLSPVELKDRVLSLFKYPKELLAKSKNLIYRYTVYTPQEEMKYILLADKDHRLEILRRVFGVDRYKRIRDNSRIFLIFLKNYQKELSTYISDLESKTVIYQEQLKEKNNLEGEASLLNEKTIIVEEKLKEITKALDQMQQQLVQFQEHKKDLEILKLKQETQEHQLYRHQFEKEKIMQEIKMISPSSEILAVDSRDLVLNEESLKNLYQEISGKNAALRVLEHAIKNSKHIKESISSLDICPLCKQKVSAEHIHEVLQGEDSKIQKNLEESKLIEEEIASLSKEIDEKNKELEQLRKQYMAAEKLILEKRYLEEKENLLARIQEEINSLEEKQEITAKGIIHLEELLPSFASVEEKLNVFMKEKENCREEKNNHELKLYGINIELASLQKQIKLLNEEIAKKEKEKQALFYWSNIQNWLEESFVKMMEVIEQYTLFKVHHDFDALFQKWFSLLIDEDELNVKLDAEFTPDVEQNGYSITYEYLSGGEKTAIALAYRLALNQVINQLLSVIKTRDMLILDEPTDGFSNAQVDKIRDVLRELPLQQVILVSHESKIESFVDHVIRLEKTGHVTRVL